MKYIENGGDGIFAAWKLCYQEDSIKDIRNRLQKLNLSEKFNTSEGCCPNAEDIQSRLMQFTTNQKDDFEMEIQANALEKTISYYNG